MRFEFLFKEKIYAIILHLQWQNRIGFHCSTDLFKGQNFIFTHFYSTKQFFERSKFAIAICFGIAAVMYLIYILHAFCQAFFQINLLGKIYEK